MPILRIAEVDLVQNDEALEINLDLLEERREQTAIREAKIKAKMEKRYREAKPQMGRNVRSHRKHLGKVHTN
ncbi:hypothetical protein Tco_0473656 [Tanacetum coccineum]